MNKMLKLLHVLAKPLSCQLFVYFFLLCMAGNAMIWAVLNNTFMIIGVIAMGGLEAYILSAISLIFSILPPPTFADIPHLPTMRQSTRRATRYSGYCQFY